LTRNGRNVVGREDHDGRGSRPRPGRRRAALSLLVVAASLGAAVALLAGGCAGGGERETGVGKVVILGVDGMDWRIIDPLIEQGELPNIAALIDRGARADFRSLEPEMKSPIIWTTIATGKGPQKHGITDFLAGSDAKPLYNSNGWLARPVWDILSEKGYTVGVINWMVTWPAQPVNGYMVTDRVVYRPEDGAAEQERVAYPEGLAEEIAPYACPVSTVTDDEIAPLVNGDEWREGTRADLNGAVEAIKSIYGNDETVRHVAEHLLESREQPDLFAVYLNGVDASSHFFWGPMDPSTVDIQMSPELISTCKDVIPRYYERMDGIIGELLGMIDENSTIILCSDHGFRGPYRSPQGLKLGIWMHRPVGVLVAAGPGIRAGARPRDASVFDVTPTILALLGEPVGRDMDGFVLGDLIAGPGQGDGSVAYVETYENTSYAPRDGETPVESAVDDEIKERLRSLGYIE
jgi:predicted AlkP superfamily phosphohydrolase/phosphomutase